MSRAEVYLGIKALDRNRISEIGNKNEVYTFIAEDKMTINTSHTFIHDLEKESSIEDPFFSELLSDIQVVYNPKTNSFHISYIISDKLFGSFVAYNERRVVTGDDYNYTLNSMEYRREIFLDDEEKENVKDFLFKDLHVEFNPIDKITIITYTLDRRNTGKLFCLIFQRSDLYLVDIPPERRVDHIEYITIPELMQEIV